MTARDPVALTGLHNAAVGDRRFAETEVGAVNVLARASADDIRQMGHGVGPPPEQEA